MELNRLSVYYDSAGDSLGYPLYIGSRMGLTVFENLPRVLKANSFSSYGSWDKKSIGPATQRRSLKDIAISFRDQAAVGLFQRLHDKSRKLLIGHWLLMYSKEDSEAKEQENLHNKALEFNAAALKSMAERSKRLVESFRDKKRADLEKKRKKDGADGGARARVLTEEQIKESNKMKEIIAEALRDFLPEPCKRNYKLN